MNAIPVLAVKAIPIHQGKEGLEVFLNAAVRRRSHQ